MMNKKKTSSLRGHAVAEAIHRFVRLFLNCCGSVCLLLFFPLPSNATTNNFSVDLQHVHIADTLRLLASFLHRNVILSPNLQGTVTMHLQNTSGEQALALLLQTYGLTKWQVGDIWYIAPREELIKQQQDESKLREAVADAAQLQTEFWQIHYGNAEHIAQLLQDPQSSLLSKRGHVRVDARTNSLVIQDLPEQIRLFRHLLQRLDVPVKQVLIKARIASVDKDYERELGVIFAVKALDEQSSNGALVKSLTQGKGNYSVAIAKLADGSLLDIKLAALEQAGHAELISNPSLFTANQQPATIEAGEEVPYQEVSESGGTAVVFKKAVLGLKVVPQVLPGDKVLLQLQLNQDRPSTKLVQGVPTISTRHIHTNVLVNNGQTVALGGIYETSQEQGENGIPILRELPIVGFLFKQQLLRKSKRELLIFVTPKVIA